MKTRLDTYYFPSLPSLSNNTTTKQAHWVIITKAVDDNFWGDEGIPCVIFLLSLPFSR